MNDFLEKWRSNNKYRAKIKLILYGLFFIIVSIYAITLNNTNLSNIASNNTKIEPNDEINKDIIKIPIHYNYHIKVKIDNNIIEYSGEKTTDEEIITKIINDETTNYLFKNNTYYIENNATYIVTPKDAVYDIINPIYINLDNINMYLSKATKNGDQYLVYLKDIILDNDTDKYFVISLNNRQINIDYTPLMKEFNPAINTYKVDITIDEKE